MNLIFVLIIFIILIKFLYFSEYLLFLNESVHLGKEFLMLMKQVGNNYLRQFLELRNYHFVIHFSINLSKN